MEGKEIRGEREGDSSPLLTQHSTPDCSSQKEKKKEKKRQNPKPLATKNKSKRTKKMGVIEQSIRTQTKVIIRT